MTLCVLTEEPALWRAGIDLYGDSEIARATATAIGPAIDIDGRWASRTIQRLPSRTVAARPSIGPNASRRRF